MRCPGYIFVSLITTGILTGCGTFEPVDRKVSRILNQAAAREQGISSASLTDARARLEEFGASTNEVVLNAETVLQLAVKYGHELQSKRDTLYSTALSLRSARRAAGLQVSGALNYIMGVSGEVEDENSGSADLSVSRLLFTGGDASVTAASSMRESPAGTNGTEATAYSSSIRLKLNQPLLKGAGYTVSHEELVQAERSLVYALRSFAQERQDYAIDLMQQYYSLLSQQTRLRNIGLNVDQSVYLRKRSEALFKVRKAAAIDVLRSQQQELSSKNNLSVAETEYEIAVKRFLITLGLPVDIRVALEGSIPEVRDIRLNEERSVDLALASRLDLLTQRDRFEDAARALWIAKNGLLPALSVYGEAAYRSAETEEFSDQELEEEISAGLSLELPLDRRDERDAMKRAQIALAAAARELRRKEDSVQIEVVENFARLEALRKTVGIEEKNVDIAQKRVQNAVLKFRAGELSNRDVVEAENELLDARNAFIEAKISYEMQRLRLLRNVGLLDVNADGRIMELAADANKEPNTDEAEKE
ncbi:MAG TPA: TolC family protein [Kiritimatiellia bacterium]|nr:TolC family protein [Kiritimatiellia bacterium]